MALSVQDKINKALKLKEEGNEHTKTAQWKKALECYHKSFLYVKGLSPKTKKMDNFMGGLAGGGASGSTSSESEIKAVDELTLSIHLNMALCHIKLNSKDRALDDCNNALGLDPKNAKALFRRGQAWFLKNNLERAEEDLKAALALQPNDAGIKQELRKVHAKVAEEEKKQKKQFAGFWDKLSKETEREEQERREKEEKEKGASPHSSEETKPVVEETTTTTTAGDASEVAGDKEKGKERLDE